MKRQITLDVAPNGGQVDLREERIIARKRAAAAELVAEEASAARLRTLLNATREQNERKPLRSAEERFDDAKGVWEAARDTFLEHQNRNYDHVPATQAEPLREDTTQAEPLEYEKMHPLPMPARGAAMSPMRTLRRGILPAMLVVMSVGVTGYFLLSDTPPARDSAQSAGFSHPRPNSPATTGLDDYSALDFEKPSAATNDANAEAPAETAAKGIAPARPRAKPPVPKWVRSAAAKGQRPRTGLLQADSRLPVGRHPAASAASDEELE